MISRMLSFLKEVEIIKKEFIKIYHISIFSSILFLVVGAFITFYPTTTINIISFLIGTVILFISINYLVKYFKFKEYNLKMDLILGVFLLVLSLLFIFNSHFISSILPFLLGIYFISNSIPKIQYASYLRQIKNSNWVISLIIALICLIFGILFILNPFHGALMIMQLIGIFMMIYAIMDLVNYFIIQKNMKKR